MKISNMVRAIGGEDRFGVPDLPMALLCASAFFSGFSLPGGRALALLCLISLIVRAIRKRGSIQFPWSAWYAVAFTILAIITVLAGPARDVGLGKLDKLAWFLTIPVAATLACGAHRVTRLLTAFSAGATVLALEICLLRPFEALGATRALAEAGKPADYLWQLTTLGSMTDGQILALAVLASTTLFLGLRGRLKWGAGIILIIQVLALIINLKRGSWMALSVAGGILVLMRTNWRVVTALVLLGVIGLLLPPVQSRLVDLRTELSDTKGGRLVMWTEIAPALLERYPAGVGFRSLTEELMQETAQRIGVTVEPDRNHLHNNLVQVTVAMGYAGLLIYLLWMTQGLVDGLRWYRRCGTLSDTSQEQSMALCSLLMLVFLLLNGVVEYNLADGELVLLYGMLFGILGTHARPGSTPHD
jgi:O-antigen ligase